MKDLIELLQNQMNDNLVDNLTDHLGIEDKDKTAVASNATFAFLTNALAKNTSSSEGTSSLISALDRDHDGSILDDLGGILTGSDTNVRPKTMDGAGILSHLLGNKQNSIIDTISKMSGLDKNKTASLMVKLAPVVLAMLNKQRKEKQMDGDGLSGFLRKTAENNNQKHQQGDFISRMIDRDGDGGIMDDIAEIGMKTLSGFFKRR